MRIWRQLGYDNSIPDRLFKQFKKDNDHEEWCKKTLEYFKKENLCSEQLNLISEEIDLIPGFADAIHELEKRHINLFIVSGSIHNIIRYVLRDYLHLFTGIVANSFTFDENGIIDKIIPTKYDFEGKREYINKISRILGISTNQFLFIGDSHNDEHVLDSGARTICINPKGTNYSNEEHWSDYILNCNSLTEIIPYIDSCFNKDSD